MNWTQYPVTQGFGVNGEKGVDLGVPFHTQLYSLLGGVVTAIKTGVGWRTEIDIASSYQGQPVTESFLHVDVPQVQVGQQLQPGSPIGLSGGQTAGGQNPDDPTYSSGPHTEYDLFRGGPWSNPMDPTAFVQASGAINPILIPGTQIPLNPFAGQGVLANPIQPLADALTKIPTDIGHGLANATGAGLTDVRVWAMKNSIALFVALAVSLVLFGDVQMKASASS